MLRSILAAGLLSGTLVCGSAALAQSVVESNDAAGLASASGGQKEPSARVTTRSVEATRAGAIPGAAPVGTLEETPSSHGGNDAES